LLIHQVAFQQATAGSVCPSSSNPKPTHKPNQGSCKPAHPSSLFIPFQIKYSLRLLHLLREIINNKYSTKLRPAKKKLK
jgi:hypothetical protein